MTLTVIVLVPMIVFFIVAQRQIVSGLVNGSVKG
jgi:raffinose/stachyose/melibiose transport system permease protein